MKSFLRNSRGMTLLEIMIVLSIVGALFALLLPRITGSLNKSNVNKTKIAMGQVISALNLYYTDCGKYPAALENLVTADGSCSNWGPEAYVKSMPRDAWGTEFTYSIDGNNFVVKSLGADRREGGDGYNKDITSEDLQ